MKTLKRIIELLEGIHHELQIANWQRNGGRGLKPGSKSDTNAIAFGSNVAHTVVAGMNDQLNQRLSAVKYGGRP